MRLDRLLEGISRNVILLGLVSLFTDLSSQMVFPLIPLYMVAVLGTGASAVGLVEGAAEMSASLLKVISGYWSDKIKRRKPFIVFGYTLSSLIKPLFALATSWAGVLVIRTVERVGKGLRNAPRDALVAESCEEKYRGKAFGFQRTMDGAGSVLGALIAYVLLHIFDLTFQQIFLFAFLPGVGAIVAASFVSDDDLEDHAPRKEPLKVSFSQLPKPLRIFIGIATLFTMGHYGYAFLLLRAKDIGLVSSKAILLYVLFYITYTICSIPAGMLSDKIGRKPVLRAAYLLFSLLSLSILFVGNMKSMIAVFVIYGVFYALVDGVQRALVSDMAPKDLKATALGTFHASTGLAALPGGFIAGFLWDKISPEATFVYGMLLSLTCFFLFRLFKRNETIKKVKTNLFRG